MRVFRHERAERLPGGVQVPSFVKVDSRREEVPGGVFPPCEPVVCFPEGRSGLCILGEALEGFGLAPHGRRRFEASGIAHEKVLVRVDRFFVMFAQEMRFSQLVERRGKPRACGIRGAEASELLRRIGIIPVIEKALREFEAFAFLLDFLARNGRGGGQQ